MKWTPHDYQRRAVAFMLNHGSAGLLLDPGLGKSSITLAAYKLLRTQGLVEKMLVVAPLRPCYSVWPAEVEKWDEFKDLKVVVLHGPEKAARLASDADIYVINPEGLRWLSEQKLDWWWDVLTVDECFPAGTRVRVEGREKDVAIEGVVPGMRVHTSAGPRKVLEVGARHAQHLVRLTLADGRTLPCTPEHPIFTDLGWMPAKYAAGRILYAADVSDLSQGIQRFCEAYSPTGNAEDLFAVLRSEADVAEHAADTAPGGGRENRPGRERSPSVEQGPALVTGPSKGDVLGCESGRPNICAERREWDRAFRGGGGAGSGAPFDIRVELRHSIGAEALRLSYLLQSRFWGPSEQDRNRSGRNQPPANVAASAGREEGSRFAPTRVVSVQNIERGGLVYNLRIEGCPHFFADGILVHNCTRFKHTNTQRFKILKPMLPKFKRRYILTGSPAPNGLLDLFGQVYILDLGGALGRYITWYRSAYFIPDSYGFKWTPQKDAEKRIYEKLRPLALRMSAADYLELPELINNYVYVDLPDEARKIYSDMESYLIAAVKDETVTAANAAAVTGKCRQIANGGVYHGDGKTTQIHEAKLDAVEEIIDELSGKPALVAYEYGHDLDRLRGRFGAETPYIGGGVSAARFREIEVAWNRGEIPVLLAQPQSAAWGLNLQGTGAAVIWHSLTWNLEVLDQFIRRIWRQGQKERVVVHHIVAKNTVDEVIIKVLAQKDRTQSSLLNALKERCGV